MWQLLPPTLHEPSSFAGNDGNDPDGPPLFGVSRLQAAAGGAAVALALLASLATPSGGSLLKNTADRHVTAPVVRGDLSVQVTATGTVEPTSLVEVSTSISGTVQAVHVKNNDRVRVGQLLAELDTSTARLEQRRAQASVRAIEARIKELEAQTTLARRELSRKSRLAGRRLTSERELDQAVAALQQAEARIEAMRAELALAAVNLEIKAAELAKAGITSPIDGLVLRRNIEPGQTIAASFAAPVLFRLAPGLENMQLRIDVDEADAMLVKAGSRARFQVHALRDQRLAARVETVYLGPEIVQGVVTYKAILSFDNRLLQLRPGMTASAEIEVASARNALLIPNAALRFASALPSGAPVTPQGPRAPDTAINGSDTQKSGHRVVVVRGGALVPLLVETGATDGSMTVVHSGELAPGDLLVIDEVAPEDGRAGT